MARPTSYATGLLDKAKGLFGREAERKAAPAKKIQPTFHAVSVALGDKACAAAKALEGKRFLSRQAPVLPLKDCDRTQCQCRYVHYDDRRKGLRRARDIGVTIAGHEADEKRVNPKRGRRSKDR